MSKRNLATVTCSLSRSDLLEFVEKHGISMCYDPQLPSSNKTAFDALEGYIPLYLSLFTIGNLRLPLNDLCLDVFKFFKCHFSLLNPFGVARVTTFVVAFKAYGGEATMPLFRSFLTLGPAGDWLTFQKRPGPNIPSIFGNSMSNIPDWKSEFILVKQTLISEVRPGLITNFFHGQGTFAFSYPTKPFDETLWNHLRRNSFEAHTFLEPILYLAGLASSWEHAPNNPSILIDREEMAFRNFMKKPGQTPSFSLRPSDQPIDVGSRLVDCLKAAVDNDQVESSSVLKDKDVSSSKKRRSITEALEEEATVVRPFAGDNSSRSVPKKRKPKVLARYIGNLASSSDSLTPDVEEAYSAHNTLSNLHYPLLKDKLGFLTFDELVNALDEVHGLGDSWDFKDVQDYHPEAEKIFVEAAEAFYKLEFPYISLLIEKASRSFEELAAVDLPSIQEASST
ncbi:hypothetical protein Tco_0747987 [Tanacetum coccineum]|uniref:Transposase (putative) gypsy type domain-containing protein n=1 Tax=Tanacetum coccineum TaxID=301880 RepID=A0ABQ4YVG8_9ASTR